MPSYRVFLSMLSGLLSWCPLGAHDLIPKPREIARREGGLSIGVQTAVVAPADLADHASVVTAALQKTTGFLHRTYLPEQARRLDLKGAVHLVLADPAEETTGRPERAGSYRLEISPEGATVTATQADSLMHGVQTLANLLPAVRKPGERIVIPARTIEDWPATSRRVFHLDVGGHLFPVADLKSLVDWLSFHKINEFHLQLNNDHGWRFESLAFPKLHEIGSVRPSTPPYGDRTGSDQREYRGYYPREMLRDLVAYARSRAVEIVPSFALTREASAIIASYPHLGKRPVAVASTWEPREVGLLENEATLEFLETLFGEVASIFPAAEIRVEGPRTPLHARLKPLLARHQRTLLVPDGFATTDLSLYPRPAESELLLAARREAEGGFNPVSRVYQLTPSPLGAQATLRTEFVHDFDKLQYLAFPRLAAFAEASWLPESRRNYQDFLGRLEALDQRYRTAGVQASRTYHPPDAQALHGSEVKTSMASRPDHPPQLIFDGREDTFFWSDGGVESGDHLTLELPWPASGRVTVVTGLPGNSRTILNEGVLELSTDGQRWHSAAPIVLGEAGVTAQEPFRLVRLRATSSQATPLILREVAFSEALLTPRHEESREIVMPVTRRKTTLTFKADFRDDPDLRDEVGEARRFFFSQWLPLSQAVGLTHFPGTPRVFELKPGEPGEKSPEEVRAWMRRKMIPWLQNYPVSSPLWFASGFTALLLEELPAETDRTQARAGGSQSAAFLAWIGDRFGDHVLTTISQDCRRGAYRPAIWKTFTRQSLEELIREYQEEGS